MNNWLVPLNFASFLNGKSFGNTAQLNRVCRPPKLVWGTLKVNQVFICVWANGVCASLAGSLLSPKRPNVFQSGLWTFQRHHSHALTSSCVQMNRQTLFLRMPTTIFPYPISGMHIHLILSIHFLYHDLIGATSVVKPTQDDFKGEAEYIQDWSPANPIYLIISSHDIIRGPWLTRHRINTS